MIKYLVPSDIPVQQFHRAVITPVRILREEKHGWWVNFINDPNPVFRSYSNYAIFDRQFEAEKYLRDMADDHIKTIAAVAAEWRAVKDKPEVK